MALAVFVLTGLRRPAPFIDPRLLVEMRWLRSATGVFVQQGSLAAVLVAVPLYLTGVAGLSVSVTGLIIFTLPVVWAVLAPLVGVLGRPGRAAAGPAHRARRRWSSSTPDSPSCSAAGPSGCAVIALLLAAG